MSNETKATNTPGAVEAGEKANVAGDKGVASQHASGAARAASLDAPREAKTRKADTAPEEGTAADGSKRLSTPENMPHDSGKVTLADGKVRDKTPDELAASRAGQIVAARDAEARASAAFGDRLATANKPFVYTSHSDGRFTIEGSGLGGHEGQVTVGGRKMPIIQWHDSIIEGVEPPDLEDGQVIVDGPAGVAIGVRG